MSDVDGSPEKRIPIEMPQLSAGDDEGEGATLASWLIGVGDEVEQGEVIAELETDKATVELESPASGRLVEIAVAEGTEGLRPGARLGTLESEGVPANEPAAEKASATSEPEPATSRDASESEADVARDAAPPSEPEPAAPSVSPAPSTPSARSTPLARRAAEVNALDLGSIEGSGPRGRVVEADVLRAAGVAPTEAEAPRDERPAAVPGTASGPPATAALPAEGEGVRVERLSAMRKTIARRLTEAKQQVPHFYLRTPVAMDEVLAVRARLNADGIVEGEGTKLSVNDFVVRAVAGAMGDVPEANVQFAEDGMRFFERVDVSVAVATDGGLVTPVVRDADRKGLTALSEEIRALAERARDGRLSPEEYQGGTVTISNLGMYGIETVYPILNPPQACIVGVGAAAAQPVVRDGEITVAHVAMFTLAADHRAVDGAVGARLLSAIRERLEDPLGMML